MEFEKRWSNPLLRISAVLTAACPIMASLPIICYRLIIVNVVPFQWILKKSQCNTVFFINIHEQTRPSVRRVLHAYLLW